MTQAAILGTGLIGASVGIGLRSAGWHVTGWDPVSSAMDGAARVGAFDRAGAGPEEAIAGADIVVLCGPARTIIDQVGTLETAAVVTDVAGVKGVVVHAARPGLRFVGGHPMAGRETSGPAGASGALFRGATWIVTTDGADPADIETVEGMARTLGAQPRRMTAAEHDEAVAVASHLPQIMAATLVGMLETHPAAAPLAAGGFRDLTRIAQSDPSWWLDVLEGNGDAVARVLREEADRLGLWADRVSAADRAWMAEALAAARHTRVAMAPPVEAVGVLLEDRPGEIALVGAALAHSGVDLRDLQLRHQTQGGGGVLTLSVRSDEAAKLASALEAQGFTLVDVIT